MRLIYIKMIYWLDFFQAYKHEHVEKHGTEIESLGIIKSADDVKNNKIANLYLNNKFHIHMSSIPFELFFHYIQDNKLTRLIRIVNQHFHVHLITSKLSPASAGGSTEKKEGITTDEHNHPLDQLHESTTSTPLHIYNKDNEDKEIMHKIKEEEQQSSLDQRNIVGMATVSFCSADIQAELDSLSDLRKRVSMGSAAPPSVCIYTFHNTHNLLNCITISEDATLVAGGFSESYIKIWSLKGEKLQDRKEKDADEPGTDYKKLIGHSGPVYGISFSHDNQYLVSSSEDQTVRLWCLNTFTNLVCYKSHNYPVWDVDFGPYGFYFATASHDKTARLWSCDHINPLRIFAGHLSDVNTVKFHPNSKYVVTGSSDKTARLWDVQRGTCVRVFTGHTGSVHCVAISPNGRLMASGGEDQTIILWDLGTGKRLKAMTGHTGFIYSLSFSSDSAVLVSGSADGTVRAWDVNRDTPYQNMFEGSDSKKRTKYDKSNGKQQQQQQQQQKESKKDAEKIKAINSNDLSNDNAKRKKGILESNDQLSAFATKNTPIYTVQFTQRNLCLAAGAMSSLSLDL
ncbi:MAG: WD40-repeat-containing domain protein [Benjaminiella poitrasii]|nr:MAG: WD40-repeat-containing domain protein [Benjaminiella poitrasii]